MQSDVFRAILARNRALRRARRELLTNHECGTAGRNALWHKICGQGWQAYPPARSHGGFETAQFFVYRKTISILKKVPAEQRRDFFYKHSLAGSKASSNENNVLVVLGGEHERVSQAF